MPVPRGARADRVRQPGRVGSEREHGAARRDGRAILTGRLGRDEEDSRAGRADESSPPGGRMGRVEGEVGGPDPQRRQHPDQQARRPLDAQGDRPTLPGPSARSRAASAVARAWTSP